MANKLHYSCNVRWSDEDEAFVATVPELPGVSGIGETVDQAAAEAHIAAELAVKVMEEDGLRAPEPERLPAYSGQFRVRLPRSLHRDLAEQAASEGVSLNTLVVERLSSGRVKPARSFQPARLMGNSSEHTFVRLLVKDEAA